MAKRITIRKMGLKALPVPAPPPACRKKIKTNFSLKKSSMSEESIECFAFQLFQHSFFEAFKSIGAYSLPYFFHDVKIKIYVMATV